MSAPNIKEELLNTRTELKRLQSLEETNWVEIAGLKAKLKTKVDLIETQSTTMENLTFWNSGVGYAFYITSHAQESTGQQYFCNDQSGSGR